MSHGYEEDSLQQTQEAACVEAKEVVNIHYAVKDMSDWLGVHGQ